jgi:hypothetical protein
VRRGDRRLDAGWWRDFAALRRYLWIPAITIAAGVAAAVLLGPLVSGDQEARFRTNVVVNALPPLFGPPVLPGPFDFAAVALNDNTVERVAAQHGLESQQLRPRLAAEPRVNSPEINFSVDGDDALAIAETWNRVFSEEVATRSPTILETLTEPYRHQRDEAEAQFLAAATAVAANPADPINQAQFAATQENYETALRLVQSYNVVNNTMTIQSFTVREPNEYGDGLGSMAGRIAAGAIIGLVLGVLLALLLDVMDRRKARADDIDQAPPSLRRVEQQTGSPR